MSRTVIAVRCIAGALYEKTLELPIEPVKGHIIRVEPEVDVAVRAVFLRPLENLRGPGIRKPAVTVVMEPEEETRTRDFGATPVDVKASALANGYEEHHADA